MITVPTAVSCSQSFSVNSFVLFQILLMKALSMLEAGASDARRNSSLGMGEDVQLSTRAKESGHQPFVDCGLIIGHAGTTIFGPYNTSPKPKIG